MDEITEKSLVNKILTFLLDAITKFFKKKRSFKQWLLVLAVISFSCCFMAAMFNVFLESVGVLPTRTPTPIPVRSVPTIDISTETPTRTAKPTSTPTLTKTASQTPIPATATLDIPTFTPGPPCNCYGPDLNCDDFPSHYSAQNCFDYCQSLRLGDVFGLDKDHDNRVCESRP